MRPKQYKPPMTLLLIVVLVALLTVLAILQYRWLGQISIAERQTMQTNLRNQARGLQEEINLEADKFGSRLRLSAAALRSESWNELAERYERWRSTATYPGLVKSLYLAHIDRDGQFDLMKLDDSAKQFKPSPWPEDFGDIRSRFDPHGFRGMREGEPRSPVAGREFGALIEHGYTVEAIPAIVRFTVELETLQSPDNEETRKRMGPETLNAFLESPLAIAVLDIDYIKQVFIPALFKRRFTVDGSLDYDMTIAYRQAMDERTEKAAREGEAPPSRLGDATVNLFSFGPNSAELNRGPRWQIVINHRAGSLDAAVTQARRRNLIASFGILSLLSMSLVVIIISSRRAQRLAQKQMDFVAGVSHEFRTPLAVIHAISENLADGLITDKRQIEQCGEVIRDDTRRLAGMVEQVLEFAGAARGKTLYQPQPVDVRDLIDQALSANQILDAHGNWHVEKEIESNLPEVMADPAALASAVRNIIDNAVKYGGPGNWIGIKAQSHAIDHTRRVEITIADKGIGIPASDLPHIFEPFYRGSAVVAAQVHGNGLGLSLVRNIVEAHGGTISVSSAPGQGSAFSLSLPAVNGENGAAKETG
ncbi:MAG TPA: HAMP domain-containing sensor histidine kinase [Blastocatellia bacterium]|nr:HAMP domain-containing sensor histidine kinase [Blastocatellia bacterium]